MVSYPSTSGTFRGFVEIWLRGLDDRQKYVVSSRLENTHGKRGTLQEIADEFDITRERVRQIEKKAVARLCKSGILAVEGVATIRLTANGGADLLSTLEASERWLAGITEYQWVLETLLETHSIDGLTLVKHQGLPYLVCATDAEWKGALYRAGTAVAAMLGNQEGVDIETVGAVIRAHFPINLPAAAQLARSIVLEHALVATAPNGTTFVVATEPSTAGLIHAVLVESNRPLHFSEIWERLQARSRSDRDIRTVQNACMRTAGVYLLGRGTYGLARHVGLSKAQQLDLAAFLGATVHAESPDRQWHASELLDLALEGTPNVPPETSVYEIAYVLDLHCDSISSLGRLVYQLKGSSRRPRIDVRQAIESILVDAGTPLSWEEILTRLGRHRGVSRYTALVQPSADYARMTSGKIGLVRRDFGLSDNEALAYLNSLLDYCRVSGQALHPSEIGQVLGFAQDVDPDTAMGLVAFARGDDRFRISASGYIYPTDWEGPRRLSIVEAIYAFVEQRNGEPWTTEEITAAVLVLTKRSDYSKTDVSMRLTNIPDYSYDAATMTWNVSAHDGEAQSDS